MHPHSVPEAQRLLMRLWQNHIALPGIAERIAAAGGELRIVGGAVRDALIERPIGDIDFACTLPPERLIEFLTQAGIKTVPTGIAYGTVTMVLDKRGYEITTLRRDVETDGRRARVAFTDDWQADAARRDFTFNALYLATDGTLYDYFGGEKDLRAGIVRFIGQPAARIREDVLRILRFYRFYAWFGQGEPDSEALKACDDLADLLPQLSVERVWREITKLLAAPDPLPAWLPMRDHRALDFFLPEALNTSRLAAVVKLERQQDLAASPLRRLAALLPSDETIAQTVARRLKLATREGVILMQLARVPPRVMDRLNAAALRRVIYRNGVERACDIVLLIAAETASVDLAAARTVLAAWHNPIFPLRGEDILALGVTSGPKLGTILQETEDWWIAQDFQPSRAACLNEAKRQVDLG